MGILGQHHHTVRGNSELWTVYHLSRFPLPGLVALQLLAWDDLQWYDNPGLLEYKSHELINVSFADLELAVLRTHW